MLQPLQLQDVSLRYPREIAELQDFFQKAGCMPGPDALHSVALRLVQERAFHRDLTSHLWVLVYTHHQNISYADLLGILAIAAAGIQAAANADEDDAHGLLGFLMEVREAFDATRSHSGIHAAQPPAAAVTTSVPPPAPAPLPQAVTPPPQTVTSPPQTVVTPAAPPQLARSETIAEPTMLQRKPAALLTEVSQQEAEKTPRSRKRLLWVAACILATLAAGLEVYHLSSPAGPASPVPAPTAPPSSAAIATRAVVPAEPAAPAAETRPSLPRKTSAATAPVSAVRSTASAPPAIAQPRNSEPPPAVAASKPSTPAPAAESPTATRATTNPSVAAATPPPRNSPAPIIRTAPVTHAASVSSLSRIRPVPIPRAALAPAPPSRTAPSAAAVHLDRPPAYTDSPGSDLNSPVRTHPAPRLVRRTPEEKAEMLASNGYAKLQVSPSSPTAAAPAVSRGNVRGESVGAYASHVVYDPTPDYPAAAAAAHVQGEVKLESEVDADGNVTSVRVVSGPPQLRAAALDAAQRWRYRPNVIGGRQMPMTTTTVFEFRLP